MFVNNSNILDGYKWIASAAKKCTVSVKRKRNIELKFHYHVCLCHVSVMFTSHYY